MLSRLATAYYFIHFLVILPLLSVVEKTRPLPQSISTPVTGGGMVSAPAAKRGKADV
jgi:ubiquinol-cytochrome c reductase cytochrome b subunit